MGCLLAIFAGLFPRLVVVLIVWIARPDRIDAAFSATQRNQIPGRRPSEA
jgi:hypothetical protein